MKHGTALLLSAGMMLASLSAVNAATADALIQAHHQRCGKPVFYAQTANHKKEVEICIITPSVSYSFGRTSARTLSPRSINFRTRTFPICPVAPVTSHMVETLTCSVNC